MNKNEAISELKNLVSLHKELMAEVNATNIKICDILEQFTTWVDIEDICNKAECGAWYNGLRFDQKWGIGQEPDDTKKLADIPL